MTSAGPSGARPALLLVEDSVVVAAVMRRVLERYCVVTSVVRAADARAALDGTPFEVVLADFALPDGDGAEVLRHAMRSQPRALRLLMSGGEVPLREAYEREGLLDGWLPKPFQGETFATLLREHPRLRASV